MDALYQLEILWIIFVQSIGAWLQEPMRMISMLGQEDFYMLVMPILYWSIDSTLGLRVAAMLLLSNGLNSVFKVSMHSPRPYWYDARIKTFAVETSFGAPSGHAQHAASIWGLIAASIKRTDGKVLLILVILLIGLSRIYLGVHFISDVLTGWAIGGVTLLVFLKIEKPVVRWLKKRSLAQMLLLSLITSILLGGALLLATTAASRWQIPQAWQANAQLAQIENEIEPYNNDGAFTIAGTWLGLMAGAAWLYHRQGGFDTSGTAGQRLLRYGIGVAGIFVFWFVLGRVFPREADALSFALRYLRYTLVGLWISAAAPVLFERLGLANGQKQRIAPLSTKENPL